jgi:hypothetical protein
VGARLASAPRPHRWVLLTTVTVVAVTTMSTDPSGTGIVVAMHTLDRADECAGAAPPRSSTARAG